MVQRSFTVFRFKLGKFSDEMHDGRLTLACSAGAITAAIIVPVVADPPPGSPSRGRGFGQRAARGRLVQSQTFLRGLRWIHDPELQAEG